MNKIAYGFLASLLFLSCASFALADVVADPNAPQTPQPFSVFCAPYTSAFVGGQAYMPTEGGACTFALPQTEQFKVVALYKGTVGSSTILESGFTISSPAAVVDLTPSSFGNNPQVGDDYFAVAYGASSGGELIYDQAYLQANAAGTPPADMNVLAWKWGMPTPPISIAVPQQGTAYVSTDSIILQATIDNLASYGSIAYLLNGTPVDPTQPLPIATLPLGTTTLVIAATNSAGNTIYATSTFMIVSGQPPVITIATPINGHSYLQNDYVPVAATITDASAIATTTYQLNGAPVDPNAQLPLMSQPLGTATFVVSSTDIFGNIGYATSTFTVLPPDLTAPTVTITNPIAGATYTDAANVFLTATVTDASPIAATSYTFNGATIDPSLPLPLLGAPLGPASVSVAATDAYGNAASTTVTFVIKSSDVIPPTITITNPIAGHTYLSTDSVTTAATITDASGVATSSYALDGIPVNPSQPLPLDLAGAGPATLVVTATDNFGNTASSSVSFTITSPIQPDTQGPVVVIMSPTAGKKYARNDSVLVVATITDASTIANVRYFFNGKLIDPTKYLQLSNAPLGNATVSVIATDKFGNIGSSTVTFRILPGSNSCIADITDAFDHKYIANKNVFKTIFEDCQKITNRGHDREDYSNDDNKKHKDINSDDRYIKAQKEIDDAFNDIDQRINN